MHSTWEHLTTYNKCAQLVEIHSNTIKVGDFSTPLTSMDRSPIDLLTENPTRKTLALNFTLNQPGN